MGVNKREEAFMGKPDLRETDVFKGFLRLSSEIGNDILKTQGAGGNTSFKQDGVMWVKASGTWLAKAEAEDIMVPVVVDPLVSALREGDSRAEKSTDFIVSELNSSGLRPSIETSFHAALNSPVVAHYHCVNAIALAVLESRDSELAARMSTVPDLTWVTIPYRRPGTPLAGEIEKGRRGPTGCSDPVQSRHHRMRRHSRTGRRQDRTCHESAVSRDARDDQGGCRGT